MPEAQPEFVASVGCQLTLVQRLQQQAYNRSAAEDQSTYDVSTEVFLVSSPGFAVLDSGCGKTIIGDRTLKQFQQLWKSDGRFSPSFKSETNVFKFGNGDRETTSTTVVMPVGLSGRFGTIQAAIVQGDAPLLLSRPALKKLGATIDFHSDRLQLFHGKVDMALKANAAGQYVVDVMDFPKIDKIPEEPVIPSEDPTSEEVPAVKSCCPHDHPNNRPHDRQSTRS
jgi:hypothetical protein